MQKHNGHLSWKSLVSVLIYRADTWKPCSGEVISVIKIMIYFHTGMYVHTGWQRAASPAPPRRSAPLLSSPHPPPALPVLKIKGGHCQGPTCHLPACGCTSQFPNLTLMSLQPPRTKITVLRTCPRPTCQSVLPRHPQEMEFHRVPSRYFHVSSLCLHMSLMARLFPFKTSLDRKITKVQVTILCFSLCKKKSGQRTFK